MKAWTFFLFFFVLLAKSYAQEDVVLHTAYTLDSDGDSAYTAHITLTNTSDTSISVWKAEFDLIEGQSIDAIWSSKYVKSQAILSEDNLIQHITLSNDSENAILQPAESVSIGFKIANPLATTTYPTGLISRGSIAPHLTALSTPTQFALGATYNIDSSWPSGYEVTVTLTNNTSTPTTSWIATFTLPQGQSIGSFWNGAFTANGQQITVSNPTWTGGGVIPGNSSTTFGMIVNNPNSVPPSLNNLQGIASSNSTPNPLPIPNAPVLNPIAVNPSVPNSYTVSWNSATNATSYTLQQDITNTFSNPQVVAQGAILSYSFSNQPNGTYFYRVSASNSTGTSPYSNIQSIAINVQPVQLTAPILNAISNSTGANQYLLSWSTVSNAQGYTLQKALTSDFSSPQTIFSGPATSYQVTENSLGTYFYRVIAFAGTSTSDPSNVVSTIVTTLPPPPTAFVEGYWESWTSSDPINAIVNMNVDIIDISFANFKTTGTHTYAIAGLDCDQATLTQFITATHNAGKKVKISVGGATYPLGPQLKTTQDAVGMAQAIAQFVQKNALDGVDFDIEDSPAASLQVALLQNTRQLLGSKILISYTAETPAATTSPYKQVIQSGYQYVDTISLMAYNYGPGYTYQQDVTALKSMGVPPSKIVIGLMPGYDDLNIYTSLSDIQTAAQYVLNNGLGGIMFWDLNRDYENQTGLGADAATNTAWNILH